MATSVKIPNIITRKNAIPFIVIFVIGMIVSGFAIAESAYCYPTYDIEYSDLMHEELTYKGYGKNIRKEGYQIYFEEYHDPFYITSIANRQVNREELEDLERGTKFSVYYRTSLEKQFEYDLCEMTNETVNIIALEDYLRANSTNELGLIIVFSLMEILAMCVILMFGQALKPGYDPMDIGKVRIEYTCYGNLIQVYKSLNVITLKINGEQVDQFIGTGTSDMRLKGIVTNGMREIPVEVTEKFALSLRCDEKAVARKIILY